MNEIITLAAPSLGHIACDNLYHKLAREQLRCSAECYVGIYQYKLSICYHECLYTLLLLAGVLAERVGGQHLCLIESRK